VPYSIAFAVAGMTRTAAAAAMVMNFFIKVDSCLS
jgi:hypothetical protein